VLADENQTLPVDEIYEWVEPGIRLLCCSRQSLTS
jgi:hypothetical protein